LPSFLTPAGFHWWLRLFLQLMVSANVLF